MSMMTYNYNYPGLVGRFYTAIPWTKRDALDSGPTMTLSAATVGAGRTLTASSAVFYSPLGTGAEWVGTWFKIGRAHV